MSRLHPSRYHNIACAKQTAVTDNVPCYRGRRHQFESGGQVCVKNKHSLTPPTTTHSILSLTVGCVKMNTSTMKVLTLLCIAAFFYKFIRSDVSITVSQYDFSLFSCTPLPLFERWVHVPPVSMVTPPPPSRPARCYLHNCQ